MKLTVIGFWGAYPEYGEPTSGYLLQTGKSNVLVECGSGVMCGIGKYLKIDELDMAFISHEHSDHCADAVCLIYNCMISRRLGLRKHPMRLYVPKELENLKKYCSDEYATVELFDENCRYVFEDFKVEISKNIHPVNSYAFSFTADEAGGTKKITYSGDTQWNDGLVNLSVSSDILLCECSLYSQTTVSIPGHMSSFDAGKLGTLSGSKKLVLTHLPHFGNHENLIREAMLKFEGKIELAKCGLTLKI